MNGAEPDNVQAMSESFPGEVGSLDVGVDVSNDGHVVHAQNRCSCLFVTAVLPYFLDEQTNPAMLALLVSGLVLILYHKTIVEERLLLARANASLGDEKEPSSALLGSVAMFGLTVVLQIMSMMIHQRQQFFGDDSNSSTDSDGVASLAQRIVGAQLRGTCWSAAVCHSCVSITRTQ